MDAKRDGGLFHPGKRIEEVPALAGQDATTHDWAHYGGASLWDFYAGQALAGVSSGLDERDIEYVCEAAANIADVMIRIVGERHKAAAEPGAVLPAGSLEPETRCAHCACKTIQGVACCYCDLGGTRCVRML